MRTELTLLCLLAGPIASTPLAAQQDPQQPPTPMLLPVAAVLPRGDAAITIDGTLTDWPELPALQLDDPRQLSGTAGRAWHGPQDLSAVAFLVWDDEALYVACVVRDEWHRALDAASLRLSEIPAADSVVLTFDPGRDTRSLGPDPGRRDDREFWLADEVGRQVVQWDRLRGTARVPDDARVVVLHDKEHSVTHYEARIPWQEILPPRHAPKAGLVFDLQVVVNDFDETTDPMPQTRIGWTFGCGAVVDPGLLGSVMLVADAAPLAGRMPEFPPKPGLEEPPVPPPEHWRELTRRLEALPPAPFTGEGPPEQAGGLSRFTLLEEIDDHCERFPRVDVLEFHHRAHRRMTREVAGIQARGLPHWWGLRLRDVSKAAEEPVPHGSLRLFRLPVGGWLVRLPVRGFLIDAAGPDLAEWLWGGSSFCLLTRPLEPTRRNDQMLVRMMHAEPPRPVLTHVAFHLPIVEMNDTPLVTPGQSIGRPGEVRVQVLGETLAGGMVTPSISYSLTVPAGPRILVAGPELRPEHVEDEPVDVLILSPFHADGPQIAEKAAARLVVLDDSFLCQSRPDLPRVRLADLHALQRRLAPRPSLILAPGESWSVQSGGAK